MASSTAAEQKLREGDPAGALVLLQAQVRDKADDPKLRVFLFQLLALLGQWDRALGQLDVASKLDAGALAMAQTYREALNCEVLRASVFQGAKSPMVLGEPSQWLAFLIESMLLQGRGRMKESVDMRARALDEAPVTRGSIDGAPFAWIADGDTRIGPVLEAVINGRYYWVPFERLRQVSIEKPEDLRDLVWMPAHLLFDNGGESVALIPTRYPGSESADDPALVMARKTVWSERVPGVFEGCGQRLLATDAGEYPIMEVREIRLGETAGGEGDAS